VRLLPGPTEGALAVTVTSLEMTSPEQVIRVESIPDSASWKRVDTDKATVSRDFYARVGGPWHWVDRLDWSADEWRAWTDRAEHHLLVCEQHGGLAGYAELEQQTDGQVEIAYFGLLPEAIGRGLGRWWLAEVIREAWQLPGTRRVWVHTCTLDGPAALSTYTGRGLQPFAREVEWRLPEPQHPAPRLAP
jgi:GNAT superfamily N-acetyltransferase